MSKLILMGTPAFVVPIFDDLRKQHEIIAVFTRKPKPTGRKMILTKTPVHLWAEEHNIPVHANIKDFDTAPKPDYIIVAAYGVILRDNVLNAAPCINLHPSDLPKYRGASPIGTAIMNGDIESAICIMGMVDDVDAGKVYMREKFKIGENDTTYDIEGFVSKRAGPMLNEYLANTEKYPPLPQTGTPTFTRKITSANLDIDWTRMPREIHNQVRAIGGRTRINGLDCKIIQTRVDDDKLVIDIIQPAGKKPMSWKDFFNGQQGKCLIAPCPPKKAIGFDICMDKDGKVQTNS